MLFLLLSEPSRRLYDLAAQLGAVAASVVASWCGWHYLMNAGLMTQPEIEEAHNFEGARVFCKEFTGTYCSSLTNVMAAQGIAKKHAEEPWAVVGVLLDDYRAVAKPSECRYLAGIQASPTDAPLLTGGCSLSRWASTALSRPSAPSLTERRSRSSWSSTTRPATPPTLLSTRHTRKHSSISPAPRPPPQTSLELAGLTVPRESLRFAAPTQRRSPSIRPLEPFATAPCKGTSLYEISKRLPLGPYSR
ncbi:hypothetical protein T484DRAFT_1917127, partial [Baffinella frigidus]